MKQFQGIWFPDDEQHMIEVMRASEYLIDGKGTYQWIKKQAKCYATLDELKSQYRTAIDVGAHVGLWAMHMAKRFQRVIAFEPITEHRKCLMRNVNVKLHTAEDGELPIDGVVLIPYALGSVVGVVSMKRDDPWSTGGTRVDETRQGGEVPVFTLDSYHIANVDFLKIDCEGYEYFVVQGGEKTIRDNKPVIVVEQKHDFSSSRYGIKDRGVVDLLYSWGATLRWSYSGDYCLSW